MKTVQEVYVGDMVSSHKNGEGMVTNKTSRTITVTFKSGLVVKNTYKNKDDYFYESDF